MSFSLNQTAPVFPVSNVKEALDWYTSALGMETVYINKEDGDESWDSWNYALMRKDSVEFHFANAKNESSLHSPSNCYLFVSGIQELQSHLKTIDAKVSNLEVMPWQHTECFLDDPFGNRIVLSQRPE